MKKRNFKLTLPYSFVYYTRKRDNKDQKFHINLNNFTQIAKMPHLRNLVKQKFAANVALEIEGLPKLTAPVTVSYYVYKPSARLIDTNNVCAIADKFFMDALVELGKLEDDNEKFCLGFDETRVMGIDRENPRIEVVIKEV